MKCRKRHFVRTDVPTRSRRCAAEPLGDDTEFNSPCHSFAKHKKPTHTGELFGLVEHRSPYTNTRSPPIRSPVSAGPNRKRKKDAADMQFSRLLRNRGNGMELRSSDVR